MPVKTKEKVEPIPSIYIEFTEKGIQVSMEHFERINAKKMNMAFRAMTRERKRLLKNYLREVRIREGL